MGYCRPIALTSAASLPSVVFIPKGSNVVPFWASYRGFWYTTPKRYYIGAFEVGNKGGQGRFRRLTSKSFSVDSCARYSPGRPRP